MRFGSVCSGIEAASVAWNPLGWKAAWFSEIEPFPCAVLAHHYPDVPNLGDMTTLLERILSGEVEAPDLLCGGTPCQSFSVAGSRKSLDDARGNLSFTFCEIANAIDTRRAGANQPPSIIFWENVPGVLSTKDNAFGCFLARLAGEDQPIIPSGKKWTNAGVVLGPQRAVAWRILDAQYFGVAQRRRRVFVIASARYGFDPASVLFEFDGVRRDFAPGRETGEDAPVPTPGSIGGHREGFGALRANEGDIGGGSENLVAKCLTAGSGSRYDFETEDFIVHGTQDGKNGIRRFSAAFSAGNSSGARSIAYMEECTPPLRAGASGTNQVPTCISMEVSGWDAAQGHLMVTPTYSISGNIIGRKPTSGGNGGGNGEEICYTLTRTDQHGVAHPIAFPANQEVGRPAHGQSQPAYGGIRVRRLTAEECEFLQGFPRSYTAIPWRNKPFNECPDGPRYKAIGNSWAVPVVNWIGRRIKLALEVAA